MDGKIEERYLDLIRCGEILYDAAQFSVVQKFDYLLQELVSQRRKLPKKRKVFPSWKAKSNLIRTIKGLYLWGDVGRGKTLLMDLFFDQIPFSGKKRVHFHEFMADIHARIHIWRQQSKSGLTPHKDPITPIVDNLSKDLKVLCFDEFSVTDIADAMILGRLFSGLFRKGLVVVATSNVQPSQLYQGGINRSLFLPFIRELQNYLEIINLDAPIDYRLQKLGQEPVYYYPLGSMADKSLDAIFQKLTGKKEGEPLDINVKGHSLHIPQIYNEVARISFQDLCGKPLGALDYIVLSERIHTLILDHVPRMNFERRNEAKRFILLIDALYNAKVKLVLSAETEVQTLCEAFSGTESFEFERTVSRLVEMSSKDYLELPKSSISVSN